MTAIDSARRYYAALLAGKGGVGGSRVADAFGTTPREHFVGAGPWTVFTFDGGYIETPSDNPAWLYQDVLVALSPGQGINNGSPGLHARCLGALSPREGETILHIGTGSGYYTAMLAALVGQSGTVIGYEIDHVLAAKAATNLASSPNVVIRGASGASGTLPTCDAIYVNAGATHPVECWLDALRPGGRLLFPLTPDPGWGGMLLVTRDQDQGFAARFVCPAGFIPCEGARDPEMNRRLVETFQRQSLWTVRSLRRDTAPDASCWIAGNRWWLSTEEG